MNFIDTINFLTKSIISFYKKQKWIILIFIIFSTITIEIINLYTNSLYFNEYALDGAFQLFNGLRRLSNNQIPGKDFFLFHGVGLYFLYYPFFIILNKTLFASEILRYLLTFLFSITSTYLLFKALNFSYKTSILFSFITFIFLSYLFSFKNLFYPGGSLLSIRSGSIIIILYLISQKQLTNNPIITGLLTAIGLFITTDQGLYLTLATSSLFIVIKRDFKSSLLFLVSHFFFYFLLLSLATKFNFYAAYNLFIYNLNTIPKNQIWYFGLPPQDYLSNLIWLLKDWNVVFRTGILIINIFLMLYVFNLKRSNIKNKEFLLVLIFYSIFSLTSIFGIYTSYYITVTTRINIALFLYLSLNILNNIYPNILLIKNNTYFSFAGLIFILLLSFSIIIKDLIETKQMKFAIDNLSNFSKKENLFVDREWDKTLQEIKKTISSTPRAWTTYSGMINDYLKLPFTSKYDYIIHALSQKDKKTYLNDFLKLNPDFIIDINPSYSIFYEWLWKENWYFYKNMFFSYTPIKRTTHYIIWGKNTNKTKARKLQLIQKITLKKTSRNISITIPQNCKTGCLLVFTFKYKYKGVATNFFRPIVHFNNYGFFNNPIGLNPYVTKFEFPLFIYKKNYPFDSKLNFQTKIEPKIIFAEWPFTNITIKKIQLKIYKINKKITDTLFKGFQL